MIALHLLETKDFMNKFLTGDLFADFLLLESTITNGVTYCVDGRLSKDATEDQKAQSPDGMIAMSTVRPMLFQMVKGTQTPSYMKFVLALSGASMTQLLSGISTSVATNDIRNHCINITYQNQQLLCTTGVSYSTFCKDKVLENEWDRVVSLYLKKHQIFFETLT